MRKLILFFMLFLISCTNVYQYEVCEQGCEGTIGYNFNTGKIDCPHPIEDCQKVQVTRVLPSVITSNICNPNYLESGARSECERVPINRLLLKGGTDKKYCNGHYNPNDFVDNYWNAEGLIDECEITMGGNEQFIFKRHDQIIQNHSGVIQIESAIINFENDDKALQIFVGEDNDNNNLPDSWIHCGNVDKIHGTSIRVIHCSGNNMKFVKLVNAPWNNGSLFIDYVQVLKIE